MSDPVNDVAFEDILDSVRRLVKSHPVRPPEAAHRAPDRLVLTSDLRVADPAAGQGDLPAPAAEPGDNAFRGRASAGGSPAAPHPSSRNQTLEARIAELEAAVNAQATDFEPDGSEDTDMHRPRAVPERGREGDPLRRLADAHRDEARGGDDIPDMAAPSVVLDPAPDMPRPSVVLDEPSHFRFRPRSAAPQDDGPAETAGARDEDGGTGGDEPAERAPARRSDDDVLAVVAEIEKLLGGAGMAAPRHNAADDGAAAGRSDEDAVRTGATAGDGAEGEGADEEDWEDLGVLSLGSAPPAMQGGGEPFSLLGPGGGAPAATAGDGAGGSGSRPRSRAHLRAVGPADDFAPASHGVSPPVSAGTADHPTEPAGTADTGDTPETAAPDEPRSAQAGVSDDQAAPDDDNFLDEDALREMVAELVRRELQGALGERISRNLRKLVRREIMRALSVRDFQ